MFENNNNKEAVLGVSMKIADEKFHLWERPVEYRFVGELQRTTMGKMDYRKLKTMF